jgi:Right handed beta helix region
MKQTIYLLALLALPLVVHGQSNLRSDQAIARIDARDAKAVVISPDDSGQVRVNCGNPNARVKTIADGLKRLGDERPAVLLISGTCHENVVIESLDRITLQGNPTATIDGGSDPNLGTVEIGDSQSIELSNLTITGGGEGVGCFWQSLCRLTRVTIQDSLSDGAGVGTKAHLQILDSVIQNNADVGLSISSGSVNFFGGSITGNGSDGVSLLQGGSLGINAGSLFPGVTIQNNAGNGVTANLHNTIALNFATVTGNVGDGVSLQAGSAMSMLGSSVTSNAGHQVRIGDLSIARFGGFANTIAGSNSPDVVCDPVFSATRKFGNLSGTTTNCPAELSATP